MAEALSRPVPNSDSRLILLIRHAQVLTDRYDVDYHYLPNLPNAGRGADGGPLMVNGQPIAMDGPDIFTALREQLGLRLEKGTGPVDFLVIEHVEKPSEN